MSTKPLSDRAMLVALNFSCWLPVRIDRRVTRETAERYGIAQTMGNYRKHCINPNQPSYKAVRQAMGSMRTAYYWYTLPWLHNGARILSAPVFQEYSEAIRKHTREVETAINAFIGEWPSIHVMAKRDLGPIYNANDYPLDIRERFAVRHVVMPLPDATDFRVTEALSDQDREKIRSDLTAELSNTYALAMRAPYERLHDAVARIAQRLHDPDGRFTETLITGLEDLCGVLPGLNLTHDPQLEALRVSALDMVRGITAQELRDMPRVRESVRSQAVAVLKTIEPHLAGAHTGAPLPEGYETLRDASVIARDMSGFSLGAL